MMCPVCDVTLLMSNREGIEIDYCPNCRGVWLDRGELDKIIERTERNSPQQSSHREANSYDDDDYQKPKRDYQSKKRKSVLGEIFDIFD